MVAVEADPETAVEPAVDTAAETGGTEFLSHEQSHEAAYSRQLKSRTEQTEAALKPSSLKWIASGDPTALQHTTAQDKAQLCMRVLSHLLQDSDHSSRAFVSHQVVEVRNRLVAPLRLLPARRAQLTPHTLKLTPHTLNLTPHTLNSTPHTLNLTPHTLRMRRE